MLTIKDVAKRAGVSIATVSAVINRNKFVSEKLKERVEKAVQELGYRPNKIAQSLKKKETKLLGVAVTEITNPFYPLMLKGIEDIARTNGYSVVLCTTDDNQQKEFKLLQSMADQGVDGIILGTADEENSKSIQFLNQEMIPHVLINRAPMQYKGSVARINSYLVGELSAQYLMELGHTNLAFIGGGRLNSLEREKAFISTLAANGVLLPTNHIIRTEYNFESVYNKMQPLLKSNNLPTAFFAASDIMAFGTIKALQNAGYRVPEDVSVIGADNIPFSEDFQVPLTTVDAKAYEIGQAGCGFLLDLLTKGAGQEKQQLLLEPKLVVRKSCKNYK